MLRGCVYERSQTLSCTLRSARLSLDRLIVEDRICSSDRSTIPQVVHSVMQYVRFPNCCLLVPPTLPQVQSENLFRLYFDLRFT